MSKVMDYIFMWQDQLSTYHCLQNAYNWQQDNEDYIFIQDQINKLYNLIDEAKGKTDEEFDKDMQESFSKNVKTVTQKREHSIITLTKNLEKDEFNYLCNYIKTFKMPTIEEVIDKSIENTKQRHQTALGKILSWVK
jgi:flagellar motor component MotA